MIIMELYFLIFTTMPALSDTDKILMKSFDLAESDLEDAKSNLFGFFEILYRIDKRMNENKQKI